MNRRIIACVLTAAVLAGTATALFPQHGATFVRLFAAAVAVVAGGLLLGAVAPYVSRDPPRTALDSVPTTGAPPLDPHGLRDARRDLGRPCPSGSVPAPVWERLAVAVRMELHGVGLDPDGHRGADVLRAGLSPPTHRLLTAEPSAGTDRDPEMVAAVVHRTLDELDALVRSNGASDDNAR